ncbi:hypothetical protein [Polaromonas sp. P5_D5]
MLKRPRRTRSKNTGQCRIFRFDYLAGALAAVPGVAASPVIGDVLVPDGVLPVVDVPIEELLPVGDGVVDGEGVVEGEAAGVEGDAPVSSTFLPQAPSANKAARATAVRAAGLNLDACMSVSFFEDEMAER